MDSTTGQTLNFVPGNIEHIAVSQPFSSGNSYTLIADFINDNQSSNYLRDIVAQYWSSNAFGVSQTSGAGTNIMAKVHGATGESEIVHQVDMVEGQKYQMALEVTDSVEFSLYLDGVLQVTQPFLDTVEIEPDPFLIGIGWTTGDRQWSGNISNVSFWNGAIGTAAIAEMNDLNEKALYMNGAVVATDGIAIDTVNLLSWFPMNEGTGTTIEDKVTAITYPLVNFATPQTSWDTGGNQSQGLQKIAYNADMSLSNTMGFKTGQDNQAVIAVPSVAHSALEVIAGVNHLYTNDMVGGLHYYIGTVEQAVPVEIVGFFDMNEVSEISGVAVSERQLFRVYDGIKEAV